jgi:hypothetical protein
VTGVGDLGRQFDGGWGCLKGNEIGAIEEELFS